MNSQRPSAAARARIAVLAVALAAFGIPSTTVHAQAGRARVEEGNRLYRDGLFEEAHQKYLEAMAEAPDAPVIPFNDGNALYQSADYERAMEAYQRAIETGDPALASAAWYNLGNALYRSQQLEPALEAYKQALRMNPMDPDAKHNLERVLQDMQQQQQQQPQDGDSEQDEEQDEEEQEQQQQEQQQQQQQQNQGPEQEEEEQQQEESPSEGDPPPQDNEGAPQPADGEMSPEEAERLLDAIEEDPEDVNRRSASARGRKPRKPW